MHIAPPAPWPIRLCARAILLAAVLAPTLGAGDLSHARAATRLKVIARILQQPRAVGLDAAGNVYVLEGDEQHAPQLIRESATGAGQTLLASGLGLADPVGQMAVDAGGTVYLADPRQHRVLRIARDGTYTPLTGDFGAPTGLALAPNGILYILDSAGNRVLTLAPGATAPVPLARLQDLHLLSGVGDGGIAVDGAGDVYLALGGDYGVARIAAGTSTVTTLAKGVRVSTGFTPGGGFNGLAIDRAGTLYLADVDKNRVVRVAADGTQTSLGRGLNYPDGLAVDAAGDLFIADRSNNRLLKLPAIGGPQLTIGPDLQSPAGLAVDARGNLFILDSPASLTNGSFVADRLIELPVGGGTATTSLRGLKAPPLFAGLGVDGEGNVYVADSGHNRLLKVPAQGGVPTIIGSGLHQPLNLAIDGAGNVFVTTVMATHGTGDKETVDLAVVRIAADSSQRVVFKLPGVPVLIASFIGLPMVADQAGNLYLAKVRDLKRIPLLKLPADGGPPVTLPALPPSVPFGMDARGNLYLLAQRGKQDTVLKLTPGAATPSTVIDSLPAPSGIAVDAQGNVYTTGDGLVREYLAG